MPYRNTQLRPSPDAVFRRLPEWGRCLVYTPSNPEVYELNPAAWLIVELAATRSEEETETDFVAIVGRRCGPSDARQQFHDGLETLLKFGILERGPPAEKAGYIDQL